MDIKALLACHCLTLLSLSVYAQAQSPPWNQLNTTLGGKLRIGIPLAAPCHDNLNGKPRTYEASQCQIVQDNLRSEKFISDQFGGYLYSTFGTCVANGAACVVPNARNTTSSLGTVSGTCSQGGVPGYYVNVTTYTDVQKSLAFVKANNVSLAIKNTVMTLKGGRGYNQGHWLCGKSTHESNSSPNFTLILNDRMHNVVNPLVFSKTFTPDGCSVTVDNTITMGAGQQGDGLYNFANQYGRDIVAGEDPGVGIAGGWITGGGVSVLSNTYGLGVDNTVQIRAVLANGSYVTANRCQNPDLFFSLRGGGGGTFGVIMEMTHKTLPQKNLTIATFPLVQLNTTTVRAFISTFVTNGPKLSSDGWGGYINVTGTLRGSILILVNPKLTNLTQAQASIKPVTDFYAKYFPGTSGQVITLPSFYQAYQLIEPRGQSTEYIGGGAALSSRIVPKQYFGTGQNATNFINAMASTLINTSQQPHPNNYSYLIGLVTPAAHTLPASDQAGGPGFSSVTPLWRKSYWHMLLANEFDGATDPGYVRQEFQAVHDLMNPIRAAMPDGGAYLNEADISEPDYQQSFWGSNFQRLSQIKAQVDPTNVLTNHQAVGYVSTDPRYNCYPSVTQ